MCVLRRTGQSSLQTQGTKQSITFQKMPLELRPRPGARCNCHRLQLALTSLPPPDAHSSTSRDRSWPRAPGRRLHRVPALSKRTPHEARQWRREEAPTEGLGGPSRRESCRPRPRALVSLEDTAHRGPAAHEPLGQAAPPGTSRGGSPFPPSDNPQPACQDRPHPQHDTHVLPTSALK